MGKPMFTNEEAANFAVNMIPGVAAIKTVGDFISSFTGDDNPDKGSSSGTSGSTQSTNSGFSSSNWSR